MQYAGREYAAAGRRVEDSDAHEPERYPQVRQVQDEQEKLIITLAESCSRLAGKLQPIMAPVPSGKTEKDSNGSGGLCPVADRLANSNRQIQALIGGVEDLIRSVEV